MEIKTEENFCAEENIVMRKTRTVNEPKRESDQNSVREHRGVACLAGEDFFQICPYFVFSAHKTICYNPKYAIELRSRVVFRLGEIFAQQKFVKNSYVCERLL